MSKKSLVAKQVVRCSIISENAELGGEFFPAHLSVALIDAVFNPRLRYKTIVVPIIERYCRRFGLHRTRINRKNLPPVEEQETLGDLIGHYEEYGLEYMREEVFDARYRSPGTDITKAENVFLTAAELQKIGIDTLQDAHEASLECPEKIQSALMRLHGIAERTINMFLMYSGNDDFVKGDVHVCRFVEKALGRKVSAAEAEKSVKEAARELKISPRILDYKIWEYESQLKPARK
jgi:thermostable 8-oxoguanine DNA glycosylase